MSELKSHELYTVDNKCFYCFFNRVLNPESLSRMVWLSMMISHFMLMSMLRMELSSKYSIFVQLLISSCPPPSYYFSTASMSLFCLSASDEDKTYPLTTIDQSLDMETIT